MDCTRTTLWTLIGLATCAAGSVGCKTPPPTSPGAIAAEPNMLLWGDSHVHTSYLDDPRPTGHRPADADTAYRFAKGLPVVHPHTRARVELRRPLDFLIAAAQSEGLADAAWRDSVDTAERHNVPCVFTTFIAWEWASAANGHDLRRVVVMDQGATTARMLVPFPPADSARPEDLWAWLAETSVRLGTDFISIPRSPNRSAGWMYPESDSNEAPMSEAYAQARNRWEPIAEVTQIRGDSEAHPTLSPDDEFADFETWPDASVIVERGAYARTALLRGLLLAQAIDANPFAFGMVGGTASETGLSSADESHFWGGVAPGPEAGHQRPAGATDPDDHDLSAQGLTGVWAEENTRTAIFDAFKRREVYATTGPRIRVRFFGSWDFTQRDANKPLMVEIGYTRGRPMGSELSDGPEGRAPTFLVYAVRDPQGANLDRIQMVKGWVDAKGNTREKVYDVVWSGGRPRGPDGKVPPVEDLVDRQTARYLDIEGATALRGFWFDPEFDPERPAFYYARVLQVPTPRRTLYDAVARGVDPKTSGHPPTIQERAYTSPIWYAP